MKTICIFLLLFLGCPTLFSQQYRYHELTYEDMPIIPTDINNLGQIVGFVNINSNSQAIKIDPDGQTTLLPALSENGSSASSINEMGDVLGTSVDENFGTRVQIWYANGTIRDLELPQNFSIVLPRDINNLGQAVGYYLDDDFCRHAVYWDLSNKIQELPTTHGQSEATALMAKL